MISYKYKCPICNSTQNIVSNYPNELVYCIYCSKVDKNPILMSQVGENKDVNVQLLLEDDHK